MKAVNIVGITKSEITEHNKTLKLVVMCLIIYQRLITQYIYFRAWMISSFIVNGVLAVLCVILAYRLWCRARRVRIPATVPPQNLGDSLQRNDETNEPALLQEIPLNDEPSENTEHIQMRYKF